MKYLPTIVAGLILVGLIIAGLVTKSYASRIRCIAYRHMS